MMATCVMKAKAYTQNRELSWLKFNERVLEEAADRDVPLLERLKFVSIFTSNLDEFFMIRVGSLLALSLIDAGHHDRRSGMTPSEQLSRIYEAVRPLYSKKTEVYTEIKESIKQYGIYPLDVHELEKSESKFVKEYFKANIEPVLSPQIVDAHHPFPHILNKELFILALLKYKGKDTLGILPVPRSLPEVVFLPGSEIRYIRTEKILLEFCQEAFKKHEILEKNILCVTRNADINADDEIFEATEDFRSKMKKLLHKRKKLSVVRVEANLSMSNRFAATVCEKFLVKPEQVFISDTALNMHYVFDLFSRISKAQQKQLTYPPFSPAIPARVDLKQDMLRQIKRKDLLFFYPFENMRAFLQTIKEAAYDANVISIKITIYRLAKKAKLVDYLCAAAENGKDVTVVLELRARFDEQNNIDWSERLEDAGCKIIYGFEDYKVHSKICLITMKERNGVSYITQVGTGNYNEKTAELYTDISIATANPLIGQDAAHFFKNMSIGTAEGSYQKLLLAPVGLKPQLLQMIDEEIEKGKDGRIVIKINSFTDMDFIEKLAQASRSGVRVRLIVRGICCLLPGVLAETENITVISVVSRFLEHSRIYSFGTGAAQRIYISSADLMTRNTENRIEVACPILDEDLKAQINDMLETLWLDNVKARVLQNDGSYIKKEVQDPPIDSQEIFIRHYALESVEHSSNKIGLAERLRQSVHKLFQQGATPQK